MRDLLIDEDGRTCSLPPAATKVRVDDPARDPEFSAIIAHAIEQLGFVFVHARRDDVRVRISQATVAPKALVTLGYWLADANPRRVVIFDQGAGPSAQLLFSQRQIMRHLGRLLSHVNARGADTYNEQDLQPGGLSARSALGALVRCWADHGPEHAERQLVRLARERVGRRFAIVEPRASGAGLVVAKLGNGFRVPNTRAFSLLVGHTFADHPDRAYGLNIDRSLQAAFANGQPTLARVDATIAWPGIGARRHRYRRLTLPLGAVDGQRRLLVATDIQGAVRFGT